LRAADLDDRQATGEIVRDQAPRQRVVVKQPDLYAAGTQHGVVDGQNQAGRIDDDAAGEARGSQDGGRGMLLGDLHLQADRRWEHAFK
jgi:hypothetical protein